MVVWVPEDFVVSVVGNDVVDALGCLNNGRGFVQADFAERMVFEVLPAVFLPPVVISPRVGVGAQGIRLAFGLLLMGVTVACLAVGKIWASGLPAGAAGL